MSKAAVAFAGLEEESLASHISDLYSVWHTAREGWRKEHAELIEYVYATDTRKTANRTNPWSHSTTLPKLTQIHDNLGTQYKDAVIGRPDWFTFQPGSTDDDTARKRKAVVSYLKTKHKYSGFSKAVAKMLQDWVQCGNCFGQLLYVRETVKDDVAGEIVTYEGPRLFRISPHDIEFDYTAKSFAEAPKVVREVIGMGEFLRQVEDQPELNYRPEVVEKIKKTRSAIMGLRLEDQRKVSQRQMDGFSDYANYLQSGKVELLHFYGDAYDRSTGELHKDCIITVVDRRFVLRNVKASDWTHVGQIYHIGWRERTDNLWAQGPLDKLVGMQYIIDHLENAKADALDQMLSPDEVYVGQVETVIDGPVRKHFIDDGNGSVSYLRPDTSILSMDFQIQLKESQMEAYAGAPREAMGIRTPGEKTAFEVDALANAAGRLFQTRINQFEEMLDQMLNGEVELARRNLNTSDLVETLDDDLGVLDFMQITADDLLIRGKLVPQGASHYARRSQAVRELQQFSQVLQGDQGMALHFPAKARAKAWNDLLDFDRFQLYQEYGGVAEQVEVAKAQQAAQQLMQENQAAAGLAQDMEGGL